MGQITQRQINVWKGELGTAGLTYSDYANAQLEEYSDLRNGIGLESDVSNRSASLWFSEGVDFTTARKTVLGPLVNTTGDRSPPDAPAIANADMELNSDWIGGNRDGGYYHGGSYSWGVMSSSSVAARATQDLDWNVEYQCLSFTFTCWAYNRDPYPANDIMIGIDDGIDETLSANITENGTWIQLTVSKTLASNATRLRLVLYVLEAGGYRIGYFDDAAISTDAFIASIPRKIIDFQGDDATKATYTIDANGIFKWVSNAWVLKSRLSTTPIDAIVATDATDEYLIVSSATEAIYSDDGDSWSALDAKCKGYLAFYDTKLRAIDTDGGTLHSSAANNIDGTWSEFDLTGHFGTVYDLFEGKLLADGTPVLYMCGTEGLYTINTSTEKAYKQEVSYSPLTYSGHKGMYWNANVWVATGYGILKVTPNLATFVGPDQDDGLPSGYQGYIYDMETVNNWLIYCVNGGSSDKSSIIKRNSSYGGNLQVYTTSAIDKPIACLHHSPSSLYTNGRLWFGEDTSVKYMMFPDITSNVKQVATYQYVNDSGYGKLPIFRSLAVIPKVALGVAAITYSCNANEYIEVFYGLNGADPTTSLGTFKTSPKPTTLTFGSGLGVEFYTIQFAIKLFRGGTNTNSPELESLMFYWYPAPVPIHAWTFNAIANDQNADQKITHFETIRDTNTLVVFYPSGDITKTSYNVKLTTMPIQYQHPNQGQREGIIQITVEEVISI